MCNIIIYLFIIVGKFWRLMCIFNSCLSMRRLVGKKESRGIRYLLYQTRENIRGMNSTGVREFTLPKRKRAQVQPLHTTDGVS